MMYDFFTPESTISIFGFYPVLSIATLL